MRDGAIPMAADDVRAILEGRKTQFRIPLDPLFAPLGLRWVPETEAGVSYADPDCWTCEVAPRVYTGRVEVGTWPGARLWVQEEWNLWHASRDGEDWRLAETIPDDDPREDQDARAPSCVDYPVLSTNGGTDAGKGPWRPAIQMPQWASRLTLTVTEVRVQRLQEITLGEICAEGLARSIYDFKPAQSGFGAWAARWDALHGKDSWDRNPLVAAITFTAERQNIDAALGRTAAHG